MATIDEVINEYIYLRSEGRAPNDAWKMLTPVIEQMPADDRQEITERLRAYETGSSPKKRIKPLKRKSDEGEGSGTVTCWNCGKPNRAGEMICVHCGKLLAQGQQPAATRQFNTEDQKPEYFGPEAMLVLYIRHSGDIIKLRPQQANHEVVVGRADANNVVKPDVDLSDYGAAQMGVSRMHMTLTYNRELDRIQITDMGSANGLYINGQKMAAKEERILRDGDQLRLGQMILDVAYQQVT